MRCVYALWPVDEEEGRGICRDLQVPFMPNRVVKGAVVKANDYASREIRTYVRSDNGLLIDRTSEIRGARPSNTDLWDALVKAVGDEAAKGHPFTLTGEGGLYKQRERLPEILRPMGRNRLEAMGREMVDAKRIVQAMATGTHTGKWLDVEGGQFALGEGKFTHGASVGHG